MDLTTFLSLPTEEVASIVRESGPKVVVFPINGTRRWYEIEYSIGDGSNLTKDFSHFFEVMARSYVANFEMLFEHGVHTVLSPLFGPSLLERGTSYIHMAMEGIKWPATHTTFLEFYDRRDVRVRYYGDYRKVFAGQANLQHFPDLLDNVTKHTCDKDRHCLFLGLYANDPVETIAELSISYYHRTGEIPDRRTVVELYYGEYIEPVDIYIGFDKFSAFDMPLLACGREDLYFTVSPSPYLTQRQFRSILYDHLFARRQPDPNDWTAMMEFYKMNIGKTLGVGGSIDGVWFPLPQVDLPKVFQSYLREKSRD